MVAGHCQRHRRAGSLLEAALHILQMVADAVPAALTTEPSPAFAKLTDAITGAPSQPELPIAEQGEEAMELTAGKADQVYIHAHHQRTCA
jgi:hypothetical protein